MKINAKPTSKYLAKGDLTGPIQAAMDFVRIETLQNPTENKAVLHFVGGQIKPLVLNVTNKRMLIAAYGDETDDWHGKPIEVYVNPDVTNSSGEIVGGVRVRIPAVKPTAATSPRSADDGPKEPHAQTLWGLRKSVEASNADAWLAWGAKAPRTAQQKLEQENAHRIALERIALRKATEPAIPR